MHGKSSSLDLQQVPFPFLLQLSGRLLAATFSHLTEVQAGEYLLYGPQ